MFLDLHNAAYGHEGFSVEDRVRSFTQSFRGVWIVAIGGFPISLDADKNLQWCGGPATPERIREEVRRGLGTSAVLTYMNRAGHTLEKLGDICAERDHDWAYHWMTVSLVFSNVSLAAELAFARDKRFFMSWPVLPKGSQLTSRVFVATGSVKDWFKFISNAESKDFDQDSRAAMRAAAERLHAILPRVDWAAAKIPWEQHFLADLKYHRAALNALDLKNRFVLEIGAGHGELTQLILDQGPASVSAFEIDKGLCKISDSRLRLYEQDVRHPGVLEPFYGWALIANPPYSLLDFVVEQLDNLNIQDALLLVPERERTRFGKLGFDLVAELRGDAFSPQSKGLHCLMRRGFDD